MPPRYHRPKMPMKKESRTGEEVWGAVWVEGLVGVVRVVVGVVVAEEPLLLLEEGKGTTAATVHTPKLWKMCLGVLRETEARFAKWNGGALPAPLAALG